MIPNPLKLIMLLLILLSTNCLIRNPYISSYPYPHISDERIDLNKANYEQLISLPGIGIKTAAHILQYRKQYGYFNSLEELTSIKGIGEATLLRLEGLIYIGEIHSESSDDLRETKEAEITSTDSLLIITFLSVGQGDATFIQTPEDYNILIDAGPSSWEYKDIGKEVLVPFLLQKEIDTLDLLILTHPHDDHIGGMLAVLEAIPVKLVLDSGFPYPSLLYEDFLSIIEQKEIEIRKPNIAEQIDLDEKIRIIIISPAKKYENCNDNSISLWLEYNQISFLFTGDAELTAEKDMLNNGLLVPTSILQAPHHGSITSSFLPFLKAVQPEVAIISCGKNNAFGHPSEEIIKRYEELGINIYRTDLDGTIIVISDGEHYQIRKQEMGIGK